MVLLAWLQPPRNTTSSSWELVDDRRGDISLVFVHQRSRRLPGLQMTHINVTWFLQYSCIIVRAIARLWGGIGAWFRDCRRRGSRDTVLVLVELELLDFWLPIYEPLRVTLQRLFEVLPLECIFDGSGFRHIVHGQFVLGDALSRRGQGTSIWVRFSTKFRY